MKIFIVGPSYIDKLDYANAIVAINDDLNICKYFTSQSNIEGMVGQYLFYMDIDDINLSFKNNALALIDYRDELITGITQDDFDVSDIVFINTEHFNLLPDILLPQDSTLIIWLDTKISNDLKNKELIEIKYLVERLDNLELPMLYFLDEERDKVAEDVIEYLNANEEERKKIIEENN